MNSGGRSGGFTLLEILLALVLLAFVMVGVWGGMRGASRVTHAADAVMAQSEQVRTVQQFLRRYVAAAGPQTYFVKGSTTARMFRGGAASMQYVAPLPLQSGHAGLYVQTLSLIKQGARGMTLVLAYQPYVGDAPVASTPVTHVLLTGLRGGAFEYLGAAEFGQAPTWRDEWQATSGLPLAVRVRLVPAWTVRVPFPEMVIRVHASEGVGARGVGTLR